MMRRIIAILMAAVMLLMGTGALAERTMTVQGVGVVNVDADRVSISLGVREIAPDVMTAQSAVNAKIDAVIGALRDMGEIVDSISTNGLGIYPNYNYDEVETIVGYTAYNNIYVTLTDVNGAGACIDAAFAAGANSLDYVEFTAADTDEAADRALVLAVDSARAKAQVLADAAGVTLGEVLEIRDSYDTGYDRNAAYAKATEEDAGAGTQVLGSAQQVFAAISVTFAIAD